MTPKDLSDVLVTIDAEDRIDATPSCTASPALLVVAGDRDRCYTPELFREANWLRR
jgi:hypothetical protein